MISPSLPGPTRSPSPQTTTPTYSPPDSPFLPPPHPLAGFPHYEYITLPTWTSDAIRLVRLHPIPPDPESQLEALPHLTTELHWLDLHKPYCALSYSWGQPEDFSELIDPDDQFLQDLRYEYEERLFVVIVDGAVYPVRKNLMEFLVTMGRRLAQPNFVGYGLFWIDAICINQEDLEERNRQVEMMWRIYRCADQVIVWLGIDRREEMERVKRMIYRLIAMDIRINKECDKTGLSPQNYWDSIDQAQYLKDSGLPALSDDVWWSFCVFWRRTWFQRLWVLQEVAIAKSIVILCGETTFEIIDLESAGRNLRLGLDLQLGSRFMRHRNSLEFRAVGRPIYDIGILLRWCQIGDFPGSEWVRLAFNGTTSTEGAAAVWNIMFDLCSSAKSSLQIDRIYGIIGIVGHLTDGHRKKQVVKVDYARNELEVRKHVFSYIFSETQWLNVIAKVQHIDGIIRRPSWVPDLRTDGHTFILHSDFNATMSLSDSRLADNLPPFTIEDDLQRLRIPAYRVDVVIEVSGTLAGLLGQPPETLARMTASLGGTYTQTAEAGMHALWKTLIAHTTFSEEEDRAIHKGFLNYWLQQYCHEAIVRARELTADHTCKETVEQCLMEWLQETFPSIGYLVRIENELCLSYEAIVELAMRFMGEDTNDHTDIDEWHDLFRAGDLFRQSTGKFSSRHQLVRTKHGFLGLAPDLAQVGDEIWLIPRTTVPFILRRFFQDDDDDLQQTDSGGGCVPPDNILSCEPVQWQLVGESYVHGIMQGELFRDDCTTKSMSLEMEYIDLV